MAAHCAKMGVCATVLAAVLAGCQTTLALKQEAPRRLAKPVSIPSRMAYAASNCAKTLPVPVEISMHGGDLQSAVAGSDFFGDAVSLGFFPAGEILAQEFSNFRRANFRSPLPGELPAATLRVDVAEAFAEVKSGAALCESAVSFRVSLLEGVNGPEMGYSETFSATAESAWDDRSRIPLSFYAAARMAVEKFIRNWERSKSYILLSNRRKQVSGGGPRQRENPAVESKKWSGAEDSQGVLTGRCKVRLNGRTPGEASDFARAYLMQDCLQKFETADPGRVSLWFRSEETTAGGKFLEIEFSAKERVAISFDFDEVAGEGAVYTDENALGFAGNPAALRGFLEDYVFEEMDKRDGVVSSRMRRGEARIEWLGKHDRNGKSIERFKLVYK